VSPAGLSLAAQTRRDSSLPPVVHTVPVSFGRMTYVQNGLHPTTFVVQLVINMLQETTFIVVSFHDIQTPLSDDDLEPPICYANNAQEAETTAMFMK